jgi:predicted ATPase/DNA-binding SARP family transcriptional activator
MRFRVLGAVELLSAEGAAQPVRSGNQRRLLAALLAHRGEVVTFDALAEALWPDGPPSSVLTTLRTYVSRLRHLVGDDLVSRGGGYALQIATEELDACRFDRLLDRATTERGRAAAGILREALDLWDGPAYGAEADLALVRGEAIRLEERRARARHLLGRSLVEAGQVDEAVAVAEALLAEEPLREPTWTVLVEALAAAGRTADALRAYQRAAEALAEAGLEPTAELRAAERAALSDDSSHRADRASSSPTGGDGAPHRAPVPTRSSSFVGRTDDLHAVADLLATSRMVTLVGPGGVGKTRLAMELAAGPAGAGRHGVAWADLSTVAEDGSVGDAVVAALGISGGQPVGEALSAAGRLEVLLVLDNAEHVLDSVCEVVDLVVSSGDRARVLATSRERVGADAEVVWKVEALPVDGAGSAASRLLVDRVRAAGGRIPLDPDDPAVTTLLTRLDGLPLAIEMVAAQLATTSLGEVVEGVTRHPSDLDPLRRGVPERHRSLTSVLEWSERRLGPDERAVLHEMSVFAGPVVATDLEGALGRPGARRHVRRLVDRSLVTADLRATPTRYGLLQTVRDHGSARLRSAGTLAGVERRHAEWGVEMAAAEALRLVGPDELAARTRIDQLLPELRTAFAWSARSEPALAADLVGHLYDHARTGLVDEPLRWAEELIAGGLAETRRPKALAGAAARALSRADLDAARALADEALEACTGGPCLQALDVRGDAELFAADLPAARRSYERMWRVALEVGNELYESLGLAGTAMTYGYGGDVAGAQPTLDRLAARVWVNPSAHAWATYAIGETILDRDPPVALAHLDEAVSVGREARSWYVVNMATVSAISLRARCGDPTESLPHFAAVIRDLDRFGDRAHLFTVLRNLAVLLARAGAHDAVAPLLGFLDRVEIDSYGPEAAMLEDARRSGRTAVGSRRWDLLVADGWAMDTATVVDWAIRESESW